MNTQWRYGHMSKITGNWLNTAVFGHMQHYNRSNVAPTESYKMSEHNIFLLQPFKHQNLQIYLKDRLSQVSVQWGYCLVLNDAHNPINNPTVQIADLHKQKTLLPGNSTTDKRIISHHDGDICFYHNDTPF